MKHGVSAYKHGRCRCEVCREANARTSRSRRAWVSPADAKEHGTRSTYANYNCRCALCRTAQLDYMRDYHRSKRQRDG